LAWVLITKSKERKLMKTYTIEFNGREDGAIGSFSDLSINVKTPYSLVGVDNAIMAIHSAGYECNYIIDIKKKVEA